MRSARDVWRQKRPHLRMRAVLVERNPVAFKELENLSSRFPDIEITTLHGDFVQSVPLILRAIHPGSFAFLFLDPKGWRIDIEAIAPLLRLPKAEVLYNFMFDFM